MATDIKINPGDDSRDPTPAVGTIADVICAAPEHEGEPQDELIVVDRPPPGPGLPESFVWLLGFLFTQIVAATVVAVSAAVLHSRNLADFMHFEFGNLPQWEQVSLYLAINVFSYVLLVPVACLRIGGRVTTKLNFSLPSLSQAALVVSMVVPLGILMDALFDSSKQLLIQLLQPYPAALQLFESFDVHESIRGLGEAPIWILLLMIAVVPALGEEFFFRGLIGRGLTARWGRVVGIGMTSVLFGLAHVYPPHVVAAIPMGIILYLVYMRTMSFWMPVLFHLVNNSMATVAMRFGIENESASSPTHIIIATVYLAASLYWLRQQRTRYLDSDGKEVQLEYPSVEVLPPRQASQRRAPNSPATMVVAIVIIALELML